jgi:two-component system, NtrC family, response regulator
MEKTGILIVEDDDEVRNQMKWALATQYDVLLAEDRRRALEILKEKRPPLATLDLGLPPSPGDVTEGFLALDEFLRLDPLLKVIVITGQEERKNALESIGLHAYDFFCKPIDIDQLKVVLARALQLYSLERERQELLKSSYFDSFEDMVGSSAQMQDVFAKIRKVATADAPVLLVGESGTGKELAARAIHRLSVRKGSPFVVINCGAIPENLLESELFGYERGAFTGAHAQRQGRIELAQRGTLFFDEIGELSPTLQVKLLRFLQDHQIERVGGRTTINVDARVISATNVDLRKAMAEGEFREDLYYRLGVITIQIPPLRERDGDIALLAKAVLARHTIDSNKTPSFSRKAFSALESHRWPGNVRELENRIKRAVIMAEGGSVSPEDLELVSPYAEYEGMGLVKAREAIEKELIEKALARNKGNLTRAAGELGISRPTLYELLEKLGIIRK